MGIVVSTAQNKIDFRSEYAYIGVIAAMISKAKNLCVRSGVAVFLLEKNRLDGMGQVRYEAVDGAFYGKNGNHFCHAMAMIGTMKGLHTPTGMPDRLLSGETAKMGGAMKSVDGYIIYIAFDGDCPEQYNLEIAKMGMAMLFRDEQKG